MHLSPFAEFSDNSIMDILGGELQQAFRNDNSQLIKRLDEEQLISDTKGYQLVERNFIIYNLSFIYSIYKSSVDIPKELFFIDYFKLLELFGVSPSHVIAYSVYNVSRKVMSLRVDHEAELFGSVAGSNSVNDDNVEVIVDVDFLEGCCRYYYTFFEEGAPDEIVEDNDVFVMIPASVNRQIELFNRMDTQLPNELFVNYCIARTSHQWFSLKENGQMTINLPSISQIRVNTMWLFSSADEDISDKE